MANSNCCDMIKTLSIGIGSKVRVNDKPIIFDGRPAFKECAGEVCTVTAIEPQTGFYELDYLFYFGAEHFDMVE